MSDSNPIVLDADDKKALETLPCPPTLEEGVLQQFGHIGVATQHAADRPCQAVSMGLEQVGQGRIRIGHESIVPLKTTAGDPGLDHLGFLYFGGWRFALLPPSTVPCWRYGARTKTTTFDPLSPP